MRELTLERFCYAPGYGTFGTWMVGGHLLYSVEQPANRNQRAQSCIPEGRYRCELDYFHKGKYPAYEIKDVPGGRTRVLIHKANWPRQVQGCIAPVLGFECVRGSIGGPSSKIAFDMFMEWANEEPFDLIITHATPEDIFKA